jgi:plasmid maintenance system antidote protein VapI
VLARNFALCEILGMKLPVPADPTEFAKALVDTAKVSPSYASELAHNRRRPSLRMAIRLEKKMGIPPRYWIERGEPVKPSAEGVA